MNTEKKKSYLSSKTLILYNYKNNWFLLTVRTSQLLILLLEVTIIHMYFSKSVKNSANSGLQIELGISYNLQEVVTITISLNSSISINFSLKSNNYVSKKG